MREQKAALLKEVHVIVHGNKKVYGDPFETAASVAERGMQLKSEAQVITDETIAI